MNVRSAPSPISSVSNTSATIKLPLSVSDAKIKFYFYAREPLKARKNLHEFKSVDLDEISSILFEYLLSANISPAIFDIGSKTSMAVTRSAPASAAINESKPVPVPKQAD